MFFVHPPNEKEQNTACHLQPQTILEVVVQAV